MDSKGAQLVRYAVMPGLIPRIRALFGSGFAVVAHLIAVVFFNSGLLPKGHPYLLPENYGRFGIRHVMAETGSRLVYSYDNTDKIIVYFTVLAGLILFVMQFVLLALSLMAVPAFATVFGWSALFIDTPTGHTPAQDMAFIVLDNVFGVKQLSGTDGFFGSCISTATNCLDINGQDQGSSLPFPRPIHVALHKMLEFYSLGIAFLSSIIIMYYVTAVIGETITSGQPFGKRFNKAWVVPRFIVFFALIAPLGGSNNPGVNGAQIITLSVAKFGSNLGTNAWLRFVDKSSDASTGVVGDVLGMNNELVARPNMPELGTIPQYMFLVRLCMLAEKALHDIDAYPYIVREESDDATSVTLYDGSTVDYKDMGEPANTVHMPYFDGGSPVDFRDAVIFSRYKDVKIRFGEYDATKHKDELGNVDPVCGEMTFGLTTLDDFVIGPVTGSGYAIQENYYLYIGDYLHGGGGGIYDTSALCMLNAVLPYEQNSECIDQSYDPGWAEFNYTTDTKWLDMQMLRGELEYVRQSMRFFVFGEETDWGSYNYEPDDDLFSATNTDGIIAKYTDSTSANNYLFTDRLRERGWAGAALWYSKIAEMNGIYASAVMNLPRPTLYPKVMEQVAEQQAQTASNLVFTKRFDPRLTGGRLADLPRAGDQYIAALLYSAFDFWNTASVQETVHVRRNSNAIIDTINMILGTKGLVDIIHNEKQNVHPMAMLSTMGKGMVDAALRNLFIGVVGQGIGKLLSEDFFLGQAAKVASNFTFKFGMIGLSIGFILYYILPLMPFIYFFFAFGGWVKSIFEAIVAMPLWAVAHLKIDGEGLPGPWASNGYFLLMEIFLRPTLIIVGFVSGVMLFSALVVTLHSMFFEVTVVATGFDFEKEAFSSDLGYARELYDSTKSTSDFMRGPVDELFFTVIYTMIVYMIGLSCFKLIDEIPNSIMRWMGVTVAAFQEQAGDPAGELSGKMFRSSQMTNAQISQLMGNANAVTDSQVAFGALGGK